MKWIIIVIGVFVLYGVLPTIIIRFFSIGIIKKGRKPHRFALTFDDGPHPVYTVRLLDLLKKYEMKATFFVVAAHARNYPHIVHRIKEEGHEIGIHHYHHISSWLMLPFHLNRELKKSERTIQQLTGQLPVLYRPPWGHFNMSTLSLAKRFTIIMWSGIFQDWSLKGGEEALIEKLKQRLEDGAVYVLHDNGDTLGAQEKAPEMMLEALEPFLIQAKEQGYKSVTISTLLQDT